MLEDIAEEYQGTVSRTSESTMVAILYTKTECDVAYIHFPSDMLAFAFQATFDEEKNYPFFCFSLSKYKKIL